jgi:hypothetical protein
MDVTTVHDLMPSSSDYIVHPEVSQDDSSFSFSSINDQVVVVAELQVTSSRLGYWSIMLHEFPHVPLLSKHKEIIEIVHFLSLVVSTSKHPESLELICTGAVILSWSEPIRGLISTDDFKSVHWVKSSLEVTAEISNLVLYLQLDCGFVSQLTQVIDNVPIEHGLILSFFSFNSLRLDHHKLSLFAWNENSRT